jgi:hypothetical protein
MLRLIKSEKSIEKHSKTFDEWISRADDQTQQRVIYDHV